MTNALLDAHAREVIDGHRYDQPKVSMVIFDSQLEPFRGRAVYLSGKRPSLSGDALLDGIAAYPGAPSRGGSNVAVDDVDGSSPFRMYCVSAADAYVLCPREPKAPCALHGRQEDHRAQVEPWRTGPLSEPR